MLTDIFIYTYCQNFCNRYSECCGLCAEQCMEDMK